MKISKFNKNTSLTKFKEVYNGDYIFVLARPKNGWKSIKKGMSKISFKDDNEFIPCIVYGETFLSFGNKNPLNTVISIVGDSDSYYIESFDIIENSYKDIQKLIDFYSNSSKYNL